MCLVGYVGKNEHDAGNTSDLLNRISLKLIWARPMLGLMLHSMLFYMVLYKFTSFLHHRTTSTNYWPFWWCTHRLMRFVYFKSAIKFGWIFPFWVHSFKFRFCNNVLIKAFFKKMFEFESFSVLFYRDIIICDKHILIRFSFLADLAFRSSGSSPWKVEKTFVRL